MRAATPGRFSTPEIGDLGLVALVGDARDDRLLHAGGLLRDPGALLRQEGGAHVQRDVVAAGELDRPQREHPRARRGHLEHLLVAHEGELARARLDARVGGEHARHVSVDLADVAHRARPRGRRPSCRSRRGPRVVTLRSRRDALEARDQHDVARRRAASRSRSARISRILALVCESSVRMPACEPVNERALVAEVVEGHRHQGARDALAGGEEHVHLARVGAVGDLLRQGDEAVGRLAARRHDGEDVVAAPRGPRRCAAPRS